VTGKILRNLFRPIAYVSPKTVNYAIHYVFLHYWACDIKMGKIEKGVRCNVVGCDQQATRSIPAERVAEAGLDIGGARRGYLCRAHYKELKRKLKKDRMIEKWKMTK